MTTQYEIDRAAVLDMVGGVRAGRPIAEDEMDALVRLSRLRRMTREGRRLIADGDPLAGRAMLLAAALLAESDDPIPKDV